MNPAVPVLISIACKLSFSLNQIYQLGPRPFFAKLSLDKMRFCPFASIMVSVILNFASFFEWTLAWGCRLTLPRRWMRKKSDLTKVWVMALSLSGLSHLSQISCCHSSHKVNSFALHHGEVVKITCNPLTRIIVSAKADSISSRKQLTDISSWLNRLTGISATFRHLKID